MISRGAIYVAVDHSDQTLDRYLSDPRKVRRPNEAIRRELASAALKAGADGVVVAGTDIEWALTNCRDCSLFLGLPDTDDLGSLVHLAADLVERTPDLDRLPLKFGVHVSRLQASSSLQILRDGMRLFPKLSIILEPYFAADLTLPEKTDYLSAAAACSSIIALKLDVGQSFTTSAAYSKSLAGLPWFARSDGLDFETFVSLFKHAASEGCNGAIVGAAIWRSELEALALDMESQASIAIMRDRIRQLRSIARGA
jgi:hypothetical protein